MRTLCIGDPKPPTFTQEFLEIEGWSGFYQSSLNNEIICFKDDLVGFLNNTSGDFVTCKKTKRMIILLAQICSEK